MGGEKRKEAETGTRKEKSVGNVTKQTRERERERERETVKEQQKKKMMTVK